VVGPNIKVRFHLNSDFSELYSLSDVDSVIYDADSEFQASLFKNTGFFLVLNCL
jgi:hypothetical protein